jgi:hypothetical protein
MGPIRYLGLRWMHIIRRAFMWADPSTATVDRPFNTFVTRTADGRWSPGMLISATAWRCGFYSVQFSDNLQVVLIADFM